MSEIGYLPLRVRTSFSGGGISMEELFHSMKEFSYVPIADIGGIWGWGKLKEMVEIEKLKGKTIKPLYGVEISLNYEKFLLFVKEKEGYYNLCKFINRKEGNGKGLATIYIPSYPHLSPIIENFEDIYIGITLENVKWIEIFKRTGLPMVWANPVNYFRNPTLYSLVLSIKKGIPFPRLKEKKLNFFSPLPKETLRKFKIEEDILLRTWEIAEKCCFELKDIIPELHEREGELREILKRKLEGIKLERYYQERVETELKAIEETGFSFFFLVGYEIINFARGKGIFYNLRGSGASSLLAYILGMSHIDPVKAGLYFERFLNKGRCDPPDLDIDFESGRRYEVVDYIFKNYAGKVSFVASFKDFKARSAIYFTGRALGLSPSECRELTKRVPLFAEPSLLNKIPPPLGAENVWKLASLLQGIHFQKSLHMGGILFTPYPITSYLPIETSAKGFPMTHFDRDGVEGMGIIKIDLLGVRGLSTISEAMKILKIDKVPQNDRKTFELIARGDTIGCFQIESPAMIDLLKKLKPVNICELANALALVRPGPTESGMKRGMIMIKNRKDFKVPSILKKLLPESHGLIIYEEHIMEIIHRIGFDWAEAEIIRRALKKGKGEELKAKFIQRGKEKGFCPEEMEELWKILGYFSSYTFNKAHAHSYAWSAYLSAYLKANHPVEFFASLLNSGGGYYPMWEYMEEAKRQGIKILPPDVRKSEEGYTPEENQLRKGLLFIKGIKKKTVKRILEERKISNYSSLEDFLRRVNLGKKEFLSLIEARGLDSLAPLSVQLASLIGTLRNIEILKDSRKLDESLGEILQKISGEYPYKIKDIPLREGLKISLPVRIVDVRTKRINGRDIVFYLLEDDTGIIQAESQDLSIPKSRVVVVRGITQVKDECLKLKVYEFYSYP